MSRSTCKLKQDLKKRVTFCRKNSFAVWSRQILLFHQTVADQEFPRQEDANHKGGGANLLIGQIFSQNMHENERNWTKGDARPWRLTQI